MTSIKSLSRRIELIPRKKIKDSRGWFLKVVNGLEKGLPTFTGEVYLVSSSNGGSRGGHYHLEATEWFSLVQGSAILVLYDVETGENYNIELDSEDTYTVVVPPKVAHRFDAVDDLDFLVVAYTNRLFDPEDTIAHSF